jgi:putative ABC transport system permease protein
VTIIKEGVGIAIDAIRSNKVRAGLSIMGVAVGVFVVHQRWRRPFTAFVASFQGDVNGFGATVVSGETRGIQLGGCDGNR